MLQGKGAQSMKSEQPAKDPQPKPLPVQSAVGSALQDS